MARDTIPDEPNALDVERGITTREAAHLLGCAEITLRQRMARGESPPLLSNRPVDQIPARRRGPLARRAHGRPEGAVSRGGSVETAALDGVELDGGLEFMTELKAPEDAAELHP